MKRLLCLLLALFCAVALAVHFSSPSVDAQSSGCTDQALALAEGQLTDTLAYTNTSQFPVSTNPANGNKWNLANSAYWTSGFFPGELWIMYEKTLSDPWLTRAQAQTASMQSQEANAPDHDIGFKILGTYGNAYRITRDSADMAVIQTAANAMATNLWRPGAGVIESWPNYDSHITVIIDNMMNLELLFWATRESGDSSFYRIAVTHANTTMRNHYRPDYSSYHVVDYDTATGQVLARKTAQGYADSSAWARGQSWGLYGYTMVYRYTHDPKYLEQAVHIADYIISRLPADKVPYWDYDAPGGPRVLRDVSAAAILASGLIELSLDAPSPKGRTYLGVAEQIIVSLSSSTYHAVVGANGGFLLMHSVGNLPGRSEIDVPLAYADYYFVEAMLRYRELEHPERW